MVHVLDSARLGIAQVRIVAGLVAPLADAGYRTEAWFTAEGGPGVESLRDVGAAVRVLPSPGPRDPRGLWRLGVAARDTRPQVVHFHGGGRLRMRLTGRLASARLVAHLHGTRGEDGSPIPLERFAGQADAVIATSRAVAASVDAPTRVVYPGVPTPDARGTEPDPPVIGTLARLEPIKNLALLLDSLPLLLGRWPALRVEIAGEGTERRALERRARDLGLGDRVAFLGWRDPEDVLARWSIFVIPSLYEGFGIAALEAMAAGLPVVASATGGLPELVADGETGFLTPVGDRDALAERLGLLLERGELRARMGRAAAQRARERFSIEAMAAGVEAVYSGLGVA